MSMDELVTMKNMILKKIGVVGHGCIRLENGVYVGL